MTKPEHFLTKTNYLSRLEDCHSHAGAFLYPHALVSPWGNPGLDISQLQSKFRDVSVERGGKPILGKVGLDGIRFGERTFKVPLKRLSKLASSQEGIFRTPLISLCKKDMPIILTLDLAMLNFWNEADVSALYRAILNARKLGVFILFHGFTGKLELLNDLQQLSVSDYDI